MTCVTSEILKRLNTVISKVSETCYLPAQELLQQVFANFRVSLTWGVWLVLQSET